MSGTRLGGLKAAQANKKKYGPDFYHKIGQKGGSLGRTGGFGSAKIGADGLTGKERSRLVGSRGGRKSKRSKVSKGVNNASTRD